MACIFGWRHISIGNIFLYQRAALTFRCQHFDCPEKTVAPHSSTLAWKIPWTEEPGRLQSMGLLRVGHD